MYLIIEYSFKEGKINSAHKKTRTKIYAVIVKNSHRHTLL